MSADGLSPVPDDLELGATIKGFIAGQRLFDRYVLRQLVGRGGMGVVWLAHDEKLEQDIALKFLPEVVRLDSSALDELKRETRRSRSLTHPHIVRIHDFVDDFSAAAISMEFVDGATLSALRVQQPTRIFETTQISEWLRQLCEALYYAHRKVKIVHRDLKPANLMINAEGDMKVTDFGIARSISDSISRVTMSRGTSGTLVYMSPQQALGQPPSVSDDIYSLGATIYELLTSKPPFYSGEILAQVERVRPPAMTQRRADLAIEGMLIPAAWEETVAACLAKNPEDRPRDVAEVAQRMGLGSVSANSTTSSVPPTETSVSTSSSPEPPKKSHGALVAIVLLLLVGGAAIGWYFGIERPAEQEQVRQAQIAQQEAIQKEKEAEAKSEQDAAEKAKLEAQAKQAADEAERLKTEADRAKALSDQKAAADAAAAKAAADKKAAADAAVQAAADQKATDDAAKAPATTNIPQDGQPWENSLGMKFVPAGTPGVLFSVWDTRVEDYQAFVTATGRTWGKPYFQQGPTHPAVMVSWDDAKAFCQWLTDKERKEGTLRPNQSYRLPTDVEWSKAVGLNESADGTPKSKEGKIKDVYPWGTTYPPPADAGNYYRKEDNSSYSNSDIAGTDGYAYTSPVGSFNADRYGLYDMGGNVWQWCEDWFEADQRAPVLRGGSWDHNIVPDNLLSSWRSLDPPDYSSVTFGFRVVVISSDAINATAPPPPPSKPGSAEITSDPSGATVSEHGKELGQTPLTLKELSVGKHTFTFALSGYKSTVVSAAITSDNISDVSATLEKEASKVSFAGTWVGNTSTVSSDGSRHPAESLVIKVSDDETSASLGVGASPSGATKTCAPGGRYPKLDL